MSGDIALGDKVRDRFSGWEGFASVKIIMFNGSTRWNVEGKDSTDQPTGFTFDEPQLELVEKGVGTPTPNPSGKVRLGDKVKDIASGWEGVMVAIYLYANGCVRYEVHGPGAAAGGLRKKPGPPKIIVLDEAMVEPLKKPEKVEAQGPKRNGGSQSMAPLR